MKYLIPIMIVVMCSISLTTYAQPDRGYFSVGISGGVLNYTGDLLKYQDMIKFLRPGVGISGSYRFDPFLSARLGIMHGSIEADDAKSSEEGLRQRNLSFRSSITELSATFVFDFIPTESYYYRRPKWTPYVFGGVALFTFNPKAQLNGEYIELKPLGTEGQFLTDPDDRYPEPYNLVQIAIPLGIGFRYTLGQNWDISIESGFRKTYTDYLDDASTFYPNMEELRAQNPTAFLLSDRSDRTVFPDGISSRPNVIRANSSTDDGYFFTNITISYILDFVRCP